MSTRALNADPNPKPISASPQLSTIKKTQSYSPILSPPQSHLTLHRKPQACIQTPLPPLSPPHCYSPLPSHSTPSLPPIPPPLPTSHLPSSPPTPNTYRPLYPLHTDLRPFCIWLHISIMLTLLNNLRMAATILIPKQC